METALLVAILAAASITPALEPGQREPAPMAPTVPRRLARLVLVAALLALAAIGLLTRDGFRRWQTSAYVVAPSSYRTWDEVFAHPAPVSVETLVTGFIDMNRCDNLDASNPSLSSCSSPEPLLDLAHLVRHARLGVYLIDSGLAARFADSPPYGNYSLAMQLFNRVLGVRNGQRAHQSAAEILRARGLHPRAVFFTHLHPDHTSGAAELPADVDYVFGSQEAGFLARVAVGSHFEGKSRLRTLDYTDVAPMPPLGPALDLLGDGSLWAISTPGHTPGHSSYLVNGDPPTLLVGDASHFAWAFEHDVAPRAWTSADGARAVKSLAELRRLPARFRRSESCSATSLVRRVRRPATHGGRIAEAAGGNGGPPGAGWLLR